MPIKLLLLPIISAFIGWFTNWIAIKMLFHPKEPTKILGITFQGIFPKRQKQFAEKLGKLVNDELINFDEIKAKLSSPEMINKAMPYIDEQLKTFIEKKLSEQLPIISMFISGDTLNKIRLSIVEELRNALPGMINKLGSDLGNDFNVQTMVSEKVSAFSSDKLEAILNDIMTKEFKFIEIIGAVLGFIIGIIQIGISML
jgi:uncharacterized membrane protein YheB (UPF0754 family)